MKPAVLVAAANAVIDARAAETKEASAAAKEERAARKARDAAENARTAERNRRLAAVHPQLIYVEYIKDGPGRRAVDAAVVEDLATSMAAIGLKTPISVRYFEPSDDSGDERFVLVAGAHRLAAARKLGWEQIECVLTDADDMSEVEARLWEISENLHRAELTVLDHDTQLAEWIRITDEMEKSLASLKSAQLGPKSKTDTNPKGSGRSEGGVNAAARVHGIERKVAQRAVKTDSLIPEAKEAAVEVGLDNNRSALLEASRAAPDKQVEAIRDIAARKAAPKQPAAAAEPVEPDDDEYSKRVAECERDHAANVQRAAHGQRYGILLLDADSADDTTIDGDIEALADDDAVLFMWTPSAELPAALNFMVEHHFKYRDHFAWVKAEAETKAGTSKINRNMHDLLLVGIKGEVKEIAAPQQSVFYGKPEPHETKPPVVHRLISEMYPDIKTRVEFGAKRVPDDWKVWPEPDAAKTAEPAPVPPASTPAPAVERRRIAI